MGSKEDLRHPLFSGPDNIRTEGSEELSKNVSSRVAINSPVVPSMFCVFIGTVFRLITSEKVSATILIHIGQFLNGVAGPIGSGAMPTLSSIWFPADERITATAIASSISALGSALPFVLGPLLVTDIPPNRNETTTAAPVSTSLSSANHLVLYTMEPGNVTAARIQRERDEIMKYMYYSCGFAGLVFLIILIYFPAKPPHPPCLSASVEREKYWSGLWSLRSKKYFVLLAVIYSVSIGVINCWASVLNVNLSSFSFTQVDEDQAGWIGFYATLGSFAGTLLVGRFASLFARQMKVFILVMFILSAGCFTVFALVLVQVIPSSYAILYTSVIGGNTLVNSAVPLIYELGCELAYPTSEGAANGFLTNIGGLIFLAVFSFPNVGEFEDLCLFMSRTLCVVLFWLGHGHYVDELDSDWFNPCLPPYDISLERSVQQIGGG
ncbi:disrupted in renal carcinoma protein 2 [Biomphalaria glabrata]|nr:disrupted in renal carcinoma protein 2 [Biomphalaria glabrata]